jgi:predicted nucleic acid-binding protein
METKNNNILIADTSALVSLIIPTDTNHDAAVDYAQELVSAQRPIMVPTEVLAETVNILGKKYGHQTAAQAAEQLLSNEGQFIIVETVVKQIRAALDIFNQEKESVSFTDAIVMAVADEQATKDIFGFDKQFEEAGYRRLKPAPVRKEAA